MNAGDIPYGWPKATPFDRMGPIPTSYFPQIPIGYTRTVPIDYTQMIEALEKRVAELEKILANSGQQISAAEVSK